MKKSHLLAALGLIGVGAAAIGSIIYNKVARSGFGEVTPAYIPDNFPGSSDNKSTCKKKYMINFDGELEDEVFDTEEDAEEYALYLQSCCREGAEILHMSNPGDYDYDEDDFEYPEYEIIEVDED